jgi:subtilisin family serine protease
VLNKIFTFIFFLGLIASSVASVRIGSELESLLNSKTNRDLAIIVRFSSPSAQRFGSQSVPQILKRKRAVTSSAQAQVLGEVSVLSKHSKLSRFQSFWIDNSLALTASPSYIRTLLEHENISELYLDSQIKLAEPEKAGLNLSQPDSTTYGLKKLRVPEVWSELGFDGSGVVVGILDTGLDIHHPDFAGRVLKTRDFVSNYADDTPNDGHGHGTHCAGTLGGGNFHEFSIGVAPGVKFLVGKIFTDGGNTSNSQIIAGMQWMADPDNNPETNDAPRIISNSWATQLTGRFQRAVDTWVELGIIPVFGAGNNGSRPSSIGAPGAYANVITVGATDALDQIAPFSSRGPVTYQGQTRIKPDLTAPGIDIYSAEPGGGYRWMSGTSMATPHVAGVLALMLQAEPDLSFQRAREVLFTSANDLGAEGLDNTFGAGRIDAFEALGLIQSGGVVMLHVDSGEQKSTLRIEPGDRVFQMNSLKDIKVSLPAGNYRFMIQAFGYLGQTLKLRVKAKATARVSLRLEQAPRFLTGFEVRDSDQNLVEARINFLDQPIIGGSTQGATLIRSIPAGDYKIRVKSIGYRSQTHEFSISEDSLIAVKLRALPPILMMDRDLDQGYESYYSRAIKGLGMEADIQKEVAPEDLMGYSFVLWFSGDQSSESVLNSKDQEVLTRYLQSGGRLILAGQDLGLRLKGTPFYNQVLGAKFLKDVSSQKKILGQGLEFRLNGGDGASNQKWPDRIEVSPEASKTAQVVFTYKAKGPAGILNKVGMGKVVYLPWGLEGVSDSRSRKEILAALIQALKPSTGDRLNRIEWAYKRDRRLFFMLLNQFKVNSKNQRDIRLDLLKRLYKTPFRSILSQLRDSL